MNAGRRSIPVKLMAQRIDKPFAAVNRVRRGLTKLNERGSLVKKTYRRDASLDFSEYRLLAFLASAACFSAFVDGAIQQFQMYLLGGQIVFGNSLIKAILLVTVVLGGVIHPRIKIAAFPLSAWLLCIGFLIVEIIYLTSVRGVSPGDVFISYYDYYFLLLIGPTLLIFNGAVSEKVLIRCSIVIFIVCAAIAAGQYMTSSPVLYTKSVDGSFEVTSYEFFGDIRAFSLFGSALEFGTFCAFIGALGVALTRMMPMRGSLLVIASGLACYTTLTRLCYLMFIFACTYSLLLTFGKKKSRGHWHPLLYFVLGIGTVLYGLSSFISGGTSNSLQSAASTIDRINQWTYYYYLLSNSTFAKLLLGSGIVQIESVLPHYPMIIDNVPLALILHVGMIGLVIFGVLITKMWLYVRREALDAQQPFIIAVASLWVSFLFAGTFAIVLPPFGAIFCLVILCEKKNVQPH